jgi:hypothetical protein
LKARDTVAGETPASLATSETDGGMKFGLEVFDTKPVVYEIISFHHTERMTFI